MKTWASVWTLTSTCPTEGVGASSGSTPPRKPGEDVIGGVGEVVLPPRPSRKRPPTQRRQRRWRAKSGKQPWCAERRQERRRGSRKVFEPTSCWSNTCACSYSHACATLSHWEKADPSPQRTGCFAGLPINARLPMPWGAAELSGC